LIQLIKIIYSYWEQINRRNDRWKSDNCLRIIL
jgi:hypothetical protein